MVTKTWKLGENATGGIITIEIKNNDIIIINKEWDYSKGSNKSSDQSEAKELSRNTVNSQNRDVYRSLFMSLTDLTTSYYSDKIIEWIKTKVKIVEHSYW